MDNVVQAVLGELQGRIARFLEHDDPSGILGEDASGLSRRAMAVAGGADAQGATADLIRTLGYLHSFREESFSGSHGYDSLSAKNEHQIAVRLFALLHRENPQGVPTPMRDIVNTLLQAGFLQGGQAVRDIEWATLLLESCRGHDDPAAVDQSIALFRRGLGSEGAAQDDQVANQYNFALALHRRFVAGGNRADLDDAVAAQQEALRCLTPADGRRTDVMMNLAALLQERFEWTASGDDLQECLRMYSEVVSSTAEGDPGHAKALSGRGIALRSRFGVTGDPADLQESVACARAVVRAGAGAAVDVAQDLSMLSVALQARYEYGHDPADLDEATALAYNALAAASPGSRSYSLAATNLGVLVNRRFARVADPDDLDEAIRIIEDVEDATAGSLLSRAGRWNCLAVLLSARYVLTGDVQDLEDCIRAARNAVTMVSDQAAERALYLSTLSLGLRLRFDRKGNPEDLDDMVALARDAVRASSPGGQYLGAHLAKLSVALMIRYQVQQDPDDLHQAVDHGRHAAEAVHPDDPDAPGIMSDFGQALRHLAESNGQAQTADEAVRVTRAALDATPIGHAARGDRLLNLAACIHVLSVLTNDADRLREAVSLTRAAIAATTDGDPARAIYMSELGMRLVMLTDYDSRLTDAERSAALGEAFTLWRAAADVRTAATSTRMIAAVRWAEAAAERGIPSEAMAGYQAAVRLLPLLAWMGLERGSREQLLAVWARNTAEAAAWALEVGDVLSAIEALEQGRSILWNQLLQLRTETSELRDVRPDLAARLDALRVLLDGPGAADESATFTAGSPGGRDDGRRALYDRAHDQRMRAADEWDQTVDSVRTLPGFAHFLRTTPFPELAEALGDATVVTVNVSRKRCDALAISAGRILVVPLPGLSVDEAGARARAYHESLARVGRDLDPAQGRPDAGADDKQIADTLKWLWDTVANPVLSELDRSGWAAPAGHGGLPERIWWSPTGALTSLPLHAAGDHASPESGHCVIDAVVSSYTPTLTMLARARARAPRSRARQGGMPRARSDMLVVSMPETPGLAPLPGARREASAVEAHFSATHISGPSATTRVVLDALEKHRLVHFACHAGIVPERPPAENGFRLHDGVLSINALAQVRPAGADADLAFLSACETRSGSALHPDEDISIAAAMHLIGFRHVIGTLWSIADSVAPFVAQDVYGALVREPGRAPALELTPFALHRAVRALRARGLPAQAWAAFVHIGP